MTTVRNTINQNLKQFKDVLYSILPYGKTEWMYFLFFLIFYLSYSLFLAFRTDIVDYFRCAMCADLYLSFDNIPIFHRGFLEAKGHPLMKWYFKPFLGIGDLLIFIGGFKAKTVFFTLLCSSLISLSVVYIFRYLKNILRLEGFPLYFVPVLYAFFSTNLVLCFTVESFTITTFLLSFTVYYYSKCISENREVTFLSNFFFSFALGGITITNFAKGIIPMFFTKEGLKVKLIKILILGGIFLLVILRTSLFLADGQSAFEHYDRFSSADDHIFSYILPFFGAPILFSEIIWGAAFNPDLEGMIYISSYQHVWQSVFVIAIFIPVIYSLIKGYKNKLFQLLVLLFLFDIVLHIVLRFGIMDSFIYGGHWIYLIPLFIGWAYKYLSKKQGHVLTCLLVGLFVVLIINNLNQLSTFISLALEKYPTVY